MADQSGSSMVVAQLSQENCQWSWLPKTPVVSKAREMKGVFFYYLPVFQLFFFLFSFTPALFEDHVMWDGALFLFIV